MVFVDTVAEQVLVDMMQHTPDDMLLECFIETLFFCKIDIWGEIILEQSGEGSANFEDG